MEERREEEMLRGAAGAAGAAVAAPTGGFWGLSGVKKQSRFVRLQRGLGEARDKELAK